MRHPAVSLIGSATLSLFLTACFAQHTSFKPTAEQKRMLAEPPLDFTVVVRPWAPGTHGGRNAKAYAENLEKRLRGSRAFRAVSYDSSGRAPVQLVAESAGDYCNTALIPLFTIVTLGVIPTVWTETQCDGVVFRGVAGGDSVVVHVRQSGRAMMGWVALPLAILPGWSLRSLAGTSAYRNALRLAILEKRAELARLAR